MGILLHNHTHTISTTDVCPGLVKIFLAETQAVASVQTMVILYGWGCRTFQTASHMCDIHIYSVWAASSVVDGHTAAQSHHHHHRCFQRFRRIGWNEILGDVSVQTMPLHYGWGLYNLFKLHPTSTSYIQKGVWAPSSVVDGQIATHSHCYHHRYFQRFRRVGWNWNPRWFKCVNHGTMLWLRL